MKYLHVEWMVVVPDGLDISDLAIRAQSLVPTEFYGLTEIAGRVYSTGDEDYGQEADRPQNE